MAQMIHIDLSLPYVTPPLPHPPPLTPQQSLKAPGGRLSLNVALEGGGA